MALKYRSDAHICICQRSQCKKLEMPFRVTMSECGSWQKSVALYLQEHLNLLIIDDPFVVKNSRVVSQFLNSGSDKHLYAFSVDVHDLFYPLPRHELLTAVEERIDSNGSVRFQNSSSVSEVTSYKFYLFT